jgi:hypothetical protein
MTMQTTTAALYSMQRMECETPRGGITIGEYIARRLHKTELLKSAAKLLQRDSAQALAQIAWYAAAGSASFGNAMHQPDSNLRGQVSDTTDPATSAHVRVKCVGALRFSYEVMLDGVGLLTDEEKINGTTVSLRGLGMPAPSTIEVKAADGAYTATLQGVITSELVPGIGRWRIRSCGARELSDSVGNEGKLTLDRSGVVNIEILPLEGHVVERRERLVE